MLQFKESWWDVVTEYLLGCTAMVLVLLAVFGEFSIGGIGLVPSPVFSDCSETASILFDAGAAVSFAYSSLATLIGVLGLRKLLDSLLYVYCQ